MKVKIFFCEDWVAVYTMGELYYEGHNLSPEKSLNLGILAKKRKNVSFYNMKEEFEDYVFPSNISDVNFKIFEEGDW